MVYYYSLGSRLQLNLFHKFHSFEQQNLPIDEITISESKSLLTSRVKFSAFSAFSGVPSVFSVSTVFSLLPFELIFKTTSASFDENPSYFEPSRLSNGNSSLYLKKFRYSLFHSLKRLGNLSFYSLSNFVVNLLLFNRARVTSAFLLS